MSFVVPAPDVDRSMHANLASHNRTTVIRPTASPVELNSLLKPTFRLIERFGTVAVQELFHSQHGRHSHIDLFGCCIVVAALLNQIDDTFAPGHCCLKQCLS